MPSSSLDGLEFVGPLAPPGEAPQVIALSSGFEVMSPVIVRAVLPGHPTLDLRLEVEAGEFVVTQMILTRTDKTRPIEVGKFVANRVALDAEETRPIQASTLRALPFRAIVDEAVRRVKLHAAMRREMSTPPGEPYRFIEFPGDGTVRVRGGDIESRRGKPVADAALERVAEIVRANSYDYRLQLQRELNISERTASRWVAEARRRGFLSQENENG